MNNMIKKSIMCILSVCLCVLVACGEAKTLPANITSEQISNAVKSALQQLPSSVNNYASGGETLDTYTMSLWADGAYEECEEFSLLEDYSLFYSADNSTFEISVLKAKNETDTPKLVSVLDRRKETLSGGDKAAYDPEFNQLMQNSKILTEGKFVILLITKDNDAAQRAIDNLKQ